MSWVGLQNRYVNHLGTVFELGPIVRTHTYRVNVLGTASPPIRHRELVDGALAMNSFGWYISLFTEKGDTIAAEAGRAPKDEIKALGDPYVFTSETDTEIVELRRQLAANKVLLKEHVACESQKARDRAEIELLQQTIDHKAVDMNALQKELDRIKASARVAPVIGTPWPLPATTDGVHVKISDGTPMWCRCNFGVEDGVFYSDDTTELSDNWWPGGRRDRLLALKRDLKRDFSGFVSAENVLYTVVSKSPPLVVNHGKI